MALMEIVVCPMCRGELELSVKAEAEGEVMQGTLICKECRERYPIEDGVPNMLPPDQRD